MTELSLTPQAEQRTQFRRQCVALACARTEAEIEQLLGDFGEGPERSLLVRVWEEEEAKRRRRGSDWRTLLFKGIGILLIATILVSAWLFAYVILPGKRTVLLLELFSPFLLTPVVVGGALLYKEHITHMQRGIARMVLRRAPTVQDIGMLLELGEWEMKSTERAEFTMPALTALTALLPVAVRTDTLKLDDYQRNIMRQHASGVALMFSSQEQSVLKRDVYPKRPTELPAETADYAAAVLLAMNALGELRGDSKEQRTACATLQKLADAPALPNEPSNHRYVREVAKESLPPVPVGRTKQ